jgi:hypothetical protein
MYMFEGDKYVMCTLPVKGMKPLHHVCVSDDRPAVMNDHPLCVLYPITEQQLFPPPGCIHSPWSPRLRCVNADILHTHTHAHTRPHARTHAHTHVHTRARAHAHAHPHLKEPLPWINQWKVPAHFFMPSGSFFWVDLYEKMLLCGFRKQGFLTVKRLSELKVQAITTLASKFGKCCLPLWLRRHVSTQLHYLYFTPTLNRI